MADQPVEKSLGTESMDAPQDVGVAVPQFISPYQIAGVAGTLVYGGYIDDQETNPELCGQTRYRTYSEMLNDIPILNAGVRFFINLLARAQWHFVPADDSKEAEEIADLIEDILMNMETPWHRVIRRAAMYRFYGFSVQEWTSMVREDGVVGFYDIAPRAQRTIIKFQTDHRGHVYGFVQESPFTHDEIGIPRWKCMYAVDDSLNDSPEGLGLFRGLYRPAKMLKEYHKLEYHGFLTDLRGIPIARVPLQRMAEMVAAGTMTEAEKDAALQPIFDFIQNHRRSPQLGMVVDSLTYSAGGDNQTPSGNKQWDIELVKGSSQSHQDLARAITRLQMEIARLLGVESVLLGDSGNGSHALSQDKSLNFGLLIDSTARELREVVKRDLLRPLFDMNGWDKKYMPTITTDAIQHRDVETITRALAQIATAGAVLAPDDPAVDEIRDLLGLSHSIPVLVDYALGTPGGSSINPPDPSRDGT